MVLGIIFGLFILITGIASECVSDPCNKGDFCALEQQGFYAADGEDCSKYYQCINGNWDNRTCANDLYFDNVACVCNHENMVSCLTCPTKEPEVTQLPGPCPPVPDTCIMGDRYADQSDCEHFYECQVDGTLLRTKCETLMDQCVTSGYACVYDIYKEECMEPYEGFDCDLRCLGTTVTTVITEETTSSAFSTSDNVVSTIQPTTPDMNTTPVLTTMVSTKETSETIETTENQETTVLSTVISSLFTKASTEVSITETWTTTPITSQYESTNEPTTLQMDSTVTTDSTPVEPTVVSTSDIESQSTTKAYSQSDITSTNPISNDDSTITTYSNSVPSTLVVTSENQTSDGDIPSTGPITTDLLMTSENTTVSDATTTSDSSVSQTVTMTPAEIVTTHYHMDTTETSHIIRSSEPSSDSVVTTEQMKTARTTDFNRATSFQTTVFISTVNDTDTETIYSTDSTSEQTVTTHSLEFISTSKQDLIYTSDQSDTTKTTDFHYPSDSTDTSKIISSISTSDTTPSTEYMSSKVSDVTYTTGYTDTNTYTESKASNMPTSSEVIKTTYSGTTRHRSQTSIAPTIVGASTSIPLTATMSNESPSTESQITSTVEQTVTSSKQTIETSDIPTTTMSQSKETSERSSSEETTPTKEATTTPFTTGPEIWQIATLVVASASAVGILMGLCFFAFIAWHRQDKEPCVDGESSSLSSCDDRRKMIEPEKEDDAVFFKPALYRSTSQWSESAFTNPFPSQKPSFERSNSTVSSIWRYSEDGLDTIKMRDQNSLVRNPVYQPNPLGKT